MVVKQLSKKEYKYRYKFIYENHLNKFAQQKIDNLIFKQNLTYKDIYFLKTNRMISEYIRKEINKILYYTFTTASLSELKNQILRFGKNSNKASTRIDIVTEAFSQLFKTAVYKQLEGYNNV